MISPYDPVFQQVGTQYGIDPNLLKTIAIKESGINPNVRDNKNPNGSYDVGMMQINTRDPEYQKYGAYQLKTNPTIAVKAAAETLQDKAKQLQAHGYAVNSFNLFRAYNGDGPQAYAYAQSASQIYQQLGGNPASGSFHSTMDGTLGNNITAPTDATGMTDATGSNGGLSLSQSIARFSVIILLGLVGVFALFQMIGGGKVVEIASKGVV